MMAPDVETTLESGLGKLINLSGKMRMLSHRVALFALLAAQEGKAASYAEAEAALLEFTGIYHALRFGSETLGISREVAQTLALQRALPAGVTGPIERFIDEANRLRDVVEQGRAGSQRLAAFTRFVADELLRALNDVTGNIAAALQQRLDHRSAHEELTRKAVREAVASIDLVSRKVKLISLNASVEASQAGDRGRGFSIIAAEIRALSEEAASATRGIMQRMT